MNGKGFEKQIYYTIACVSEFAQRYRMSEKAAFAFLEKYGGIAFVKDYYASEHTLSFDDAVDDMTRICQQNGGYVDEIVSRK